MQVKLEEFTQQFDKQGKTPEGAVKYLLIAVLETVKENNPEGKKMWGYLLPAGQVSPKGEPAGANHRTAQDQFAKVIKGTKVPGAIAASYLGGTPANGYAYSYDKALVVDKTQTSIEGDEGKLFVKSSGKDSSSPVLVKKEEDGHWKIHEYSSLYTSVKPATSK